MTLKSSSERLAEAMENARRHWKQQIPVVKTDSAEHPLTPIGFTIAISRESGAQGSLIARKVADKLGWHLYNRELLQKIADDQGLRVQLLHSVDEKHKNWLQECVEAYASALPSVTEEAYVEYLVEALLSLSTLGNCVIVGRGAAQFLPPEKTFRVRLVGPQKERIAVLKEKFGISDKEASKWVEKTDKERDRFVRDHFHKDASDPSNYDLVINTCRYSPAYAAEVIVQGWRRFQEQVCPQ